MSQIQVNQLTFYYDGSYDSIFENVTFQIDTDWKLGFIGRNGRGKTTFLKLLTEEYEYVGKIIKSVKVEYFPQKIVDKSVPTLEIVEKIQPAYEFWRVCMELELLQVDSEVLWRPFHTLSHGGQTKVLLAVLFSGENQFLLIDEPTNHLDVETRGKVKEYLKGKKGFILVSHDRDVLDAVIDHVLVINKTDIQVFQGNFSTWWENKKRQDEYELNQNRKLKKDIRRLTEAAARTEKWAETVEKAKIGKKSPAQTKNIVMRDYVGEKSRRMQQRKKNLERRQQNAMEEKAGLLKNIETVDDLKLLPLQAQKKRMVTLENVDFCYPGSRRKILENFFFEVNSGERIALTGINGCGKSSVLKLITEELSVTGGKKELAGGLIISYVPQDTSFLKGSLREYISRQGVDESLMKALLRKLDFDRVQFEKNMEDYSAGQKKKVVLAKSLCEQAHLYIWDEPLNYIDIFSRIQIEKLLLEYQPTMLFVEHDQIFVDQIATRVKKIEKIT